MPGATIKVSNPSRDTVLATRAETARTWCARGCGLLGRSGLPAGGGLIIHPCNSVHTLGMAFAIDVLHLNRRLEVLRVSTMPPWRIGPLVLGSSYVLEIPAGAAAGTIPGDRLKFIPQP